MLNAILRDSFYLDMQAYGIQCRGQMSVMKGIWHYDSHPWEHKTMTLFSVSHLSTVTSFLQKDEREMPTRKIISFIKGIKYDISPTLEAPFAAVVWEGNRGVGSSESSPCQMKDLGQHCLLLNMASIRSAATSDLILNGQSTCMSQTKDFVYLFKIFDGSSPQNLRTQSR